MKEGATTSVGASLSGDIATSRVRGPVLRAAAILMASGPSLLSCQPPWHHDKDVTALRPT